MSYIPQFAPDAKSEWHELDVELQEAVLDQIEQIASNPPLPPRRAINFDVVLDLGGKRHYLFLRVLIDHTRKTATVLGVGHFARSI